jgi:hypothetical protein
VAYVSKAQETNSIGDTPQGDEFHSDKNGDRTRSHTPQSEY